MDLKIANILLPAMFALLSVVFLGSTINGLVVSESCCTGPSCSPDTLCEIPGSDTTSLFSLAVAIACFMFSIVLYYILNRKKI